MKKSLAIVVCAVALAFVMFAPSRASAGGVSINAPGVSININRGYYGGYRYPRYGYGYGYPRYGYGYPRYRYGYGYPRYRYGYGYPRYRYGYPRARSYVRRGVRRHW